MARIHIALVGGQTVPTYIIAKMVADTTDKFILVSSLESKKLGLNLQNVMEKDFQRPIESINLPAFNIPQIKDSIMRLKEDTKNDVLTIDITSGSKPWSILFYNIFHDRPQTTIYFDDQNNNVWNLSNDSKSTAEGLGLEKIFELNGQRIIKKDFKNISPLEVKEAKTIQKLRSKYSTQFARIEKQFRELPKSEQQHPEGYSFENLGCKARLNEDEIICDFRHTHITLQSPNRCNMFFNAGWFEIEVAELLSKWSEARSVWINCILQGRDGGAPLNEYDIIVFNGIKYLFVECKTQVNTPTDVDKFNNVKSYGGLQIKRIFITDAEMKPMAKVKCQNAGIQVFCMKDIRNNANAEKRFYDELNNIMNRIDTK